MQVRSEGVNSAEHEILRDHGSMWLVKGGDEEEWGRYGILYTCTALATGYEYPWYESEVTVAGKQN